MCGVCLCRRGEIVYRTCAIGSSPAVVWYGDRPTLSPNGHRCEPMWPVRATPRCLHVSLALTAPGRRDTLTAESTGNGPLPPPGCLGCGISVWARGRNLELSLAAEDECTQAGGAVGEVTR